MEFFKIVSAQEARQKLCDHFADLQFSYESIKTDDACERILAEDITAGEDIPSFDRSTVDGYAVRSKDTIGACATIPAFFQLIGEIKIGQRSHFTLKEGEAIYVPTGGMIPDGADSVVMIEHVENLDDKTIAIQKATAVHENILRKGDDIKMGEQILKKGQRLTPHNIGILVALGITQVKVFVRPRFAIVSTGDEIVPLGEEIHPGEIRDINTYTLRSLIYKLGGEVSYRCLVKDDATLLQEELKKALSLADIVLISGGSSVGERDYTLASIRAIQGKILIHGIGIKPGKPTILARAQGKPVFGVPGHPVSAMTVFREFVEYLVRCRLSLPDESIRLHAFMAQNIHGNPGMETYQMVTLEKKADKWMAIPRFGKSGMITLLAKANGYVIIKSDQEGLNQDEQVEVYLL